MPTPPPPVVRLSDALVVDGNGPVVILGANGAGKTRLGTRLVALNGNAFRVPALRLLVVGTYAATPTDAANQLVNIRSTLLQQPWQQSNDVDHLLAKALADEARFSLRRSRELEANVNAPFPPPSALSRVFRLWREVFPARELDFNLGLSVTSTLSGATATYAANQMSDGERTVLYLALSCFDAPPGIVIVDEPTTHLHPELARRYWNAVERERPECRMIYMTHDLEFALSRRQGRIVIKRPGDNNLEPVPAHGKIPKDVLSALLGAASFAVVAKRIVICEGDASGDDEAFYTAWFNDPGTAVVPLGTSTHVTNAHSTVTSEKLVQGADLIPIVDRDDWSDDYLERLESKGVFVLKVSELEALYCLQAIVLAVAKHVAFQNIAVLSSNLKAAVTKRVDGALLHRLTLERTKRALRHRMAAVIDRATPAEKFEEVQKSLASAMDPMKWSFDPKTVLSEEKSRLVTALAGDWDADVLRVIPGKEIFGVVVGMLGISADIYKGIVLGALGKKDEYQSIREEVVSALSQHLPPRSPAGSA